MDHSWNPMGGFQPPTTQHHHHTGHHNATGQTTTSYIPTPEQEVAVARSQMFETVHHLSVALRNAANQCDNFVKVVSRHHPSAAATAFASNAGADFLALASGATLGAGALAHAGAPGVPGVTVAGTPGRKPLTKDERRALRKERKLNRDPNAPKRPPSAYLLFQNEIREDMRQQYKDLSYSDVLGKISDAWKNLSEAERKVYQDRTVQNMEKWHQEKREHQSGDATADGDAAAAAAAVAAAAAAAAAAGEADVVIDAADAGEQDSADAAAAAGQDLLATNGLASVGKAGSRKAGAASGGTKTEKRARKN